jgi:hypothetical protein
MRSLAVRSRAILLSMSVALLWTASAHGQVADALKGKMRWWQQVAGTWQCTIHLQPVAGQSEGYGPERIAATPMQGNTLHMHSDLIGMHADDYIGYSEKTKVWWDAEADNFGNATLATSPDNVTFTQVSDSKSLVDKDPGVYRVIYLFRDGLFGQRLESHSKHSWIAVSEEVCHRRS